MGAEKVVVVEGEKCVQCRPGRLAQHGSHDLRRGQRIMAQNGLDCHCQAKDVSIWADADDDAPPDKPKAKGRPGQTAAMEIAAHLHGLGCRVRVALPEPDGGADIADWLAVGEASRQGEAGKSLLRDYRPEVAAGT